MKVFTVSILVLIFVSSCVPAKKYNELLEKEQQESKLLATHKNNALNYETEVLDLRERTSSLTKDLAGAAEDTARLGQDYRVLLAKYDKQININEALETNFDRLTMLGADETALLTKELEAKKIELQIQEDELRSLEVELTKKQDELEKRELRVAELEELIHSKDAATSALKEKVAKALISFKNKGLSVEERNGKIYVSLEAKLLFDSGSTTIGEEGKMALIELAKVLEVERELEIVVEGHTDTDKLESTNHPKSNWELSVLRSTAVVDILLSNSKMLPEQLMAAGRSQYHPVSESDKTKNRRIEIIISPNLNELYDLISN